MNSTAPAQVKRMWLEAKIIRADGTVEDLGTIADSGQLTGLPGLFNKVRQWVFSLL